MKIGVLSSSRADFGIYLPLLTQIEEDEQLDLEIIAFGMHLSEVHGAFIEQIQKLSFTQVWTLETMKAGDTPEDVTLSYANTVRCFASFWKKHTYDWVICLGDRYEMSAAVQATIPFGVRLAHLHGGETTLGAIDNIYRHQITLASSLHFCATDAYAEKIRQLTGPAAPVEVVGALSLDGVENFAATDYAEWVRVFGLAGLRPPFLLVTVHPETKNWKSNGDYAAAMTTALEELAEQEQIVITMPNADTQGSLFRQCFHTLQERFPERVFLVENFGKQGYFSAMYYAAMLVGNSSSGILEAASFGKYVVDVGERQRGRARSANVISVPFEQAAIVRAVHTCKATGGFTENNIYYRGGAAERIISTLKKYRDS